MIRQTGIGLVAFADFLLVGCWAPAVNPDDPPGCDPLTADEAVGLLLPSEKERSLRNTDEGADLRRTRMTRIREQGVCLIPAVAETIGDPAAEGDHQRLRAVWDAIRLLPEEPARERLRPVILERLAGRPSLPEAVLPVAVASLGHLGLPEDARLLLPLVGPAPERSPLVRMEAARAISRIGDREAYRALADELDALEADCAVRRNGTCRDPTIGLMQGSRGAMRSRLLFEFFTGNPVRLAISLSIVLTLMFNLALLLHRLERGR